MLPFFTAFRQPRIELTGVKMNDYGKPMRSSKGDETHFSSPGPIGSDVDMNHIGTPSFVGKSLKKLMPGSPVGTPFRPYRTLGVRWEQVRLPTDWWMFSEGVHHRGHAAARVAGTNVQHLAHELARHLGIKKW